ncbi:MAG: hypothetical protein WCQ66_00215 [Sphaerochaetaceae bacterium]|jgi:hypothetical protein|nr:hypothetical protein [Bacteroidales bacterium]
MGVACDQISLVRKEGESYRFPLSINRIAKKTGERETLRERNKPMAYAIATKAALSGFDRSVAGERQMLDEYVEKFWDFDDSAYIDRKNKAKKGSVNRDCVEAIARFFRLHVKPLLRKNFRLDDLKVRDVQGIQDSLLKNGELSNKTINDCILSVAKPYHEALRLELVTSNPFDRVLKLPLNTKERGIPTRTELEKTLEILHPGKGEGQAWVGEFGLQERRMVHLGMLQRLARPILPGREA